jgi:hypothetical protein
MKKFIIVDTFNGEGYSDSSAEIIEVSSKGEARDYAIRKAREFSGIDEELVEAKDVEIFKAYDRIQYGINRRDDATDSDEFSDKYEDYGAVHFEELPVGIVSVTINPDVNEYTLHDAESDAEVIEYIKSESDEEELEDCHHLDDEVVIYQKF